jgi:probable F420-dependent oxidoreductase
MLEVARARSAGVHPYFTPPEHTAVVREAVGPDALIAPEQAVVLDTDMERARTTARVYMAGYLGLPNYTNNLLRLGYTEDDIADGGSDRLVDAIVPCGDLETVAARVEAHRDAGADHVCLQPLRADNTFPLEEWRQLASLLKR